MAVGWKLQGEHSKVGGEPGSGDDGRGGRWGLENLSVGKGRELSGEKLGLRHIGGMTAG